LYKSGFSYQKMTLIAKQRDELLRVTFANDVSVYNPKMIVFVDETGADRRNMLRKYGYSIQGKPARSHKLLCRGQHISIIAMMSSKGLLDCKILHGSVNGESFYEFIHTHLIAHLQPFNGSNSHSVVILDNASIHHTEDAVKAIEDVGPLVHFLPPYFPDLNPVEEAFSKVKNAMKLLEEEDTTEDIEIIALSAFATITQDDCRGWINDSKIYSQA